MNREKLMALMKRWESQLKQSIAVLESQEFSGKLSAEEFVVTELRLNVEKANLAYVQQKMGEDYV